MYVENVLHPSRRVCAPFKQVFILLFFFVCVGSFVPSPFFFIFLYRNQALIFKCPSARVVEFTFSSLRSQHDEHIVQIVLMLHNVAGQFYAS